VERDIKHTGSFENEPKREKHEYADKILIGDDREDVISEGKFSEHN
jgi:hypothetical protein